MNLHTLVDKPLVSDDLYYVIAKACMYNPDQRYQSMEEMLLDIEKLMYDVSLGYMKEHKNSSLAVGTIMLALGIVAWKLTMAPEMIISFSLWEYILLLGCLGKGIQKIFKKDVALFSMCVLGVGIYLMVVTGFSWIKLIFLLWMTFSSGGSAGYLSAGVLIANFISLVQQAGNTSLYSYAEYSWVTITVISIALVLLCQYELLTMEDRKTAKLFYKKGFYWGLVIAIYAVQFWSGSVMNPAVERMYRAFWGDTIYNLFFSFDRKMVGLYGLGFSLFWVIREKLLIFRQKGKFKE